MSRKLVVMALCLFVLAGACWAADDGVTLADRGIGTPDLKSPYGPADDSGRVTIDFRYWEAGNDTITAGIDYALTDDLSVGVNYVRFDNVGRPPIAGALRASEVDGPGVWLKYVVRDTEPGSWGAAVIPGVEFLDIFGTNQAIDATAGDQETVFTLECPIGIPTGDALWIIDPKLATFPSTAPVFAGPGTPVGMVLPAEIDSFGTVFGVGLGGIAPLGPTGRWWVYANVTPILAGDNAIDAATNDPTIQLPWTAGIRWDADVDESLSVDVFATTAAGGTTATSLLAAPDKTVAIGARAVWAW